LVAAACPDSAPCPTRGASDLMTIAESVRQAVAEVDRNKPVANMRTVEEYLDRQVQYVRLYVLLLGIFGGIAAGLAAIGIYGVMRSEEHTSELQSLRHLVCRLL